MSFNSVVIKTGQEALLPVLLFFISFAVYWPGLHGDFFLDDYAHIVHNSTIQITHLTTGNLWAATNSTNSGPLGRPLALASFALNYYFTGLNSFYFKLTNLLIHALSVVGVYLLLRRVTKHLAPSPHALTMAFIAALLWAIHPLNVSTVLYAVQRMTGLAALFTVWGMVLYCHGRELQIAGKNSGWAWLVAGATTGFIGLFAKETAVLMLGYLLVIECLAFRFQMPTTRQRHTLQALYAATLGLPLAWALTTHLFATGWAESAYANRTFTLKERLLTEARVLWDYLSLTWLPNIQSMGLYHDGYRISRSLVDPVTTIFAVSGHILLIASAIALRARWPVFIFAIAWFYIGHSAESSILPLEIKYEHRNYLPMLGMLLLLVHSVFIFTERLQNSIKIKYFTLVAIALTFSGSTIVRSAQFGDFWGFSGMEAEHHPESSRANQNAAVSLMKLMIETKKSNPQLVSQATEYLRRSAEANPNSTAPLFTAVLFLPEITHQPASKELLNELSARLGNALPDANTNSYFTALLRQAEEGKLMLPPDQVHELFKQAEANPLIPKGSKTDIIAARAAYAQSVEHDNAKARMIIDRALITDPERSGVYVPAVWIYQEAGMWQDAARLLEKLRKLDTYGIESHSIVWLSQRQHSQSTKNR